jgi:hypothetical protein
LFIDDVTVAETIVSDGVEVIRVVVAEFAAWETIVAGRLADAATARNRMVTSKIFSHGTALLEMGILSRNRLTICLPWF